MHAIDITRHHFQPAKHYSGVLHYQGSVLLDSEQNEGAFIQQAEGRRVLTDLLVTSGSPDDGMKIGPITPTPAGYDFEIAAGAFYLGGMRLDVERIERFTLQSEHLQQRELAPPLDNDWLTNAQSAVPAAPPVVKQTDLVWLEAYEYAVTQTEDSECIETGLAVESSARLRPMRKVHVFPGVGAQDCGGAFNSLVVSLESAGRFDYDEKTAELKSNRRLTVDFVDVGPDPDPCSPPIRRGFLGADNETIQIRTVSDTMFVWSFGNAAPLYRQTTAGNVVTFKAPPRDELMRPLVGDLIEIIRCDAILPNGELIGERHGLFFRVVAPYNPGDRTVGIAPAPAFPINTLHADDLATAWGIDKPDKYLFARVWRGESMTVDPIGKTMSPAPGIQLGNTGIRVSFTGKGPVGDSWTFSVRPNTPEVIVPWEMRKGAPPTAPRRFITGLGLINWSGNAAVAPTFVDCRRHVRKLENAAGCCEVTVGDGTESFGDVPTIAKALDRLPASGGKICLLRGKHYANVMIDGRTNITIEGCGPLTKLFPAPVSPGMPVISIVNSRAITIRNFAIETDEGVAIAIDDLGQFDFGEKTSDIDIRGMLIRFRDGPAIFFNGGEGLKVEQSALTFKRIAQPPQAAGSTAGMSSSIVLLGRDMLVERCRIDKEDEDGDQPRVLLPLGGIHVVGGSERVEIRRNRIAEGGGIGIVLGSVHYSQLGNTTQPTRLEPATKVPWKDYGKAAAAAGQPQPSAVVIGYEWNEDGCFWVPVTEIPPTGDNPPRPNADPLIIDCRIIENDIENMGSSGIAPFMQFDLTKDLQLCGVAGLIIRNNKILDCVLGEAQPLIGGQYVYTARGGVVLGWAENLELVGNHIERCGTGRADPICGLFAVGLAHARISENRIHDNGKRIEAGTPLLLGQRGGIVIRYVQPSVSALTIEAPQTTGVNIDVPSQQVTIPSAGEALLLHENQVIAPEGRALEIKGVGAMSINDNQLASQGATAASLVWLTIFNQLPLTPGLLDMFAVEPVPAIFGNAVVSVVNLGISNDIGLPIGLGPVGGVSAGGDVGPASLAVTTGRLLFANNQTRYDGLSNAPTLVPCLIGLFSLDDAKMIGNQCDADFYPRMNNQASDFAFTHGLVMAVTMQMNANRFSEPTVAEDDQGQLSGLCVGMSVLMHHNFGSHCFLALPFDQLMSIVDPNRSIVKTCERWPQRTIGRLDSMLGSSQDFKEAQPPAAAVSERHVYYAYAGSNNNG